MIIPVNVSLWKVHSKPQCSSSCLQVRKMVRNYKRTTDRSFSEEQSRSALSDVLSKGISIRAAASAHGIKKSRLAYLVQRAKEGGVDNMSVTPYFRNRQVIPDEREGDLAKYLLKCSQMFYGLTPKHTRQLAFQYAKQMGLILPATWNKNEEAGKDWFSAFMKRQPTLSLRTPEATTLGRMTAFNRHTVGGFFDKLDEVMKRYGFCHSQIFNLDETGVNTVPRCQKIIGGKGQKQIGLVTSRERGETVTQVGIICANGNALPPVWIFPRVRFDETRMMAGAPAGALGLTHKSGWMTSENFLKVLLFFKDNTRCSKEKPVLLIMDNHESHLSVEGLDFCKQYGIVILTLPPHTSNKLQPLDVSVFGPFKTFYSAEVNNWMNSHPNNTMNIYVIPKLAGKSWDRGANPENIKSGFKSTGIFPFDRNIFSDKDFMPSEVSDRPCPTPSEPQPGTSSMPDPSALSNIAPTLTPESIKPFPKAQPRQMSNRGRRRGKCMIATDTPEKLEIQERKGKSVKKKLPVPSSSSSSESEENQDLCEEPGDSPLSISASKSESSSEPEDNEGSYEVGDYAVIKFAQKKGFCYYVGFIVSLLSPGEFEIRFLRKKGVSFIYPNIEDKSIVPIDDLCCKIALQSSRRGKYYFKNLNRFPNMR